MYLLFPVTGLIVTTSDCNTAIYCEHRACNTQYANLLYCDSSNAFSRVDISLTWLARLKRLTETPGRNKTVLGYHGVDRSTLGMVGSGKKTTGTLEFGAAGGIRNPIWA